MNETPSRYSPTTMDELLALLPAGARVLDLGCGRGSFPYAAYPALHIDALDEFAAPMPPFPAHARYQQGHAETLPYADDSFDLVITNFVMEHVTDFPAALDQIARVLAPRGYFYMAIPNARSFEDALYRSLYAGGGHLQRHTFESVMATVYARTTLKLLGYIEWPAGFNYLHDLDGLHALTARVAEACRESLGVDIRERSNYIFVFQASESRGRPTVTAVCRYCGAGTRDAQAATAEWTCTTCQRVNRRYTAANAADERLEAAMQDLWSRHPHLRETGRPETSILRRARLAVRMLRRGHI